jgi:thiosulfate dehydrogenase
MRQGRSGLGIIIGLLLGAVAGAAAGYYAGFYLGSRPVNWYSADIAKLGPGPDNDLIRYGRDLIVNTPRHIGKNATDPAMRYAGNDLSCQNCHLNAGLQRFAAPFVSTFATFPMMVDDQVLTLTDRINGCMRRSLNGKDLPSEGREMEAIVAYLKFVGRGTPEGVRVSGMGLRPIENPTSPPDARRGEAVYVQLCVTCHKEDGQGRGETQSRRWLFHSAVVGGSELQRRRRHGQDRLCRLLYPRQHAVRDRLPGAGAQCAAGMGCGGLYDLQAASTGDTGNCLHAAIDEIGERIFAGFEPCPLGGAGYNASYRRKPVSRIRNAVHAASGFRLSPE